MYDQNYVESAEFMRAVLWYAFALGVLYIHLKYQDRAVQFYKWLGGLWRQLTSPPSASAYEFLCVSCHKRKAQLNKPERAKQRADGFLGSAVWTDSHICEDCLAKLAGGSP